MNVADVAPPDSTGSTTLLGVFGAVVMVGLIVTLILVYVRRRR